MCYYSGFDIAGMISIPKAKNIRLGCQGIFFLVRFSHLFCRYNYYASARAFVSSVAFSTIPIYFFGAQNPENPTANTGTIKLRLKIAVKYKSRITGQRQQGVIM